MNKKHFLLVVIAVVLIVVAMQTRSEHYVTPLYARPASETPATIELPAQPPAWLHVEVETNWAWFWQKSKGRAWVTEGKLDTLPVDVGKLCIRLIAHGTTEKCEYGTREITVQERRRGVQIAKRTAIVTALAEFPALDAVTVRMEP